MVVTSVLKRCLGTLGVFAAGVASLRAEQVPTLAVTTSRDRYFAYEPILVKVAISNNTERPISILGSKVQANSWSYYTRSYAALVRKPRAGEPLQPPSDQQYLHVRPIEDEKREPEYFQLLPGQTLSGLSVVLSDYHRRFGSAHNVKGQLVPVPPDPYLTPQAGILWLRIVHYYDYTGGGVKRVVSPDIPLEIQRVPQAEKDALAIWKNVEIAEFLQAGGLSEPTRRQYRERIELLRTLEPQTPEEDSRRRHELQVLRDSLDRDSAVRRRLTQLVERYPHSVYAGYARVVLQHGPKWLEALAAEQSEKAAPKVSGTFLVPAHGGDTGDTKNSGDSLLIRVELGMLSP